MSKAKEHSVQAENCALVVKDYIVGQDDKKYCEKNQNCGKSAELYNLLLEESAMKNITKRSDGRYMGRVQIDGKTFSVYAQTQKECLKKLSDLKKEIKKQIHMNIPKNITLPKWADEWFSTFKEPFIGASTKRDLLRHLAEIKKHFRQALDKVSVVSVQSFLNKYPTSRKKEVLFLYLNAMLEKAKVLNLIKINPCKLVVRERKIKNTRPPFFAEEQESMIKALEKTDIYAPIMLYLFTGIRRNEFPSDPENEIVNHTLKIESEKKRQKKAVYRYIDLSPAAESFIRRHSEELKGVSTESVYRKFSTLLKEIGITGKSIHNLRHTFSSNHYILRTPIKQVSEWLGHETVELTNNIYTHIDRAMTAEKVRQIYQGLYYEF